MFGRKKKSAKSDDEPARLTNIALGMEMAQPASLSEGKLASYHQGLKDFGQYSEDTLSENAPLAIEIRIRGDLERDAKSVASEQQHVIEMQQRFITEAASSLASSRERCTSLEAAASSKEASVESDLVSYEDKVGDIYIPNIRRLSDPSNTMMRVSLSVLMIGVLGGIAELVVNYLAAQYFGELLEVTMAIALVISFVTVMLPWWAGRTIAQPQARFKAFAWIGLVLLVVLLVGVAWLRYQYAQSSFTNQNDLKSTAAVLSLSIFSFVTPLTLAVIILLKVIFDNHQLIYEIWRSRRQLRQLHEELAQARGDVSEKESEHKHARESLLHKVFQAEVAIEALSATCLLYVAEYFRGLKDGLKNPMCTAKLDMRLVAFERDFADYGREVTARTAEGLRAANLTAITEVSELSPSAFGEVLVPEEVLG